MIGGAGAYRSFACNAVLQCQLNFSNCAESVALTKIGCFASNTNLKYLFLIKTHLVLILKSYDILRLSLILKFSVSPFLTNMLAFYLDFVHLSICLYVHLSFSLNIH